MRKRFTDATSSTDEYLEILLKQSKAAITREGSHPESRNRGGYGWTQHAAYPSFRKRSWTGHFHAQVSAPPAE